MNTQLNRRFFIIALASLFLSAQVYASTASTPSIPNTSNPELNATELNDMSMNNLMLLLTPLNQEVAEEQALSSKENNAQNQATTQHHEERIKKIADALKAMELAKTGSTFGKTFGWISSAAMILGAAAVIGTGVEPGAAWLALAGSIALQSIELAENESISEELRVVITAQLMSIAMLYWNIYKIQ